MTKVPFPPENHQHPKKEEYIIIEEAQEYTEGPHVYSSAHRDDDLLNFKTNRNPFIVRFLCLLGAFFSLVIAAGFSTWVIVSLALSILFLFQNERFNRKVYKFWRLLINTLVISFSLFVAVFSPTLGFSLLILYFTLKGESKDSEWVRRSMKRYL